MRAYLTRDPYAREWLVRDYIPERELGTDQVCLWDGRRSLHGGLYQYGKVTDGGRYGEIPGLFCSKDCMLTYHGP